MIGREGRRRKKERKKEEDRREVGVRGRKVTKDKVYTVIKCLNFQTKLEFKTVETILTDSLAGFVICVIFTVLRHNRENVKSVIS